MIWTKIDACRERIDAAADTMRPASRDWLYDRLADAESFAVSQWIGAALDTIAAIDAAIPEAVAA